MKTLLFVMTLLSLSFVSTARADHMSCRNHYDNGALSNFARHESEMLAWESRYQAARSGSSEEHYARERVQFEGREALEALGNDGQALWSEWPRSVEQFARVLDDRYQAARSGSPVEAMYRSARAAAWHAYIRSEIEEVGCAGYTDYVSVVRRARELDSKYQSSRSGSEAESAYRVLRERFWHVALDALRAYLAGVNPYDFRQVEQLAAEFAAGYQSSQSGSNAESFYREARVAAYETAFRLLSQRVYSLATEELLSLQGDYGRRYQSAPSGSADEGYFRRVRELITQELERRIHRY